MAAGEHFGFLFRRQVEDPVVVDCKIVAVVLDLRPDLIECVVRAEWDLVLSDSIESRQTER